MMNERKIKMKVFRAGYQSGLSLIELMISILLGLILTIGVVSVYIESKNNYQSEDQLARIQENGRYALTLLKRELTLAGFYAGNLETDSMTPSTLSFDCASNWALNTTDSLDMIDDFDPAASSPTTTVNSVSLGCLTASSIVSGTDIISVKRTAGDYTLKNGVWNDGLSKAEETQWYLKVTSYGESLDWVYIGSGEDFTSGVGSGSEVDYWEYSVKVFYVQNYSSTAGDNIPTLCAESLSGNSITAECYVEGIEDVQIEFGIDTDEDGVANQYKPYSGSSPTISSTELATAVSARIYVLARGINPVAGYTNSKTYSLGEKTVAAKNDGYMRRVFSTTVQMRNATLPAS